MSVDRRAFLKSLVRGVTGLAVIGGTGWLVGRNKEPCWTGGACRICPELDTCELPEGKLTRLQRLRRRGREDDQ